MKKIYCEYFMALLHLMDVDRRAGSRPPGNDDQKRDNPKKGPLARSLSTMVSQFKATTTRRINEIRNTPSQPIWQRNYNDRIIRNEVELDKIRIYIRTNPERG